MMRKNNYLKMWLLTKEKEFCQIFSEGKQAKEQSELVSEYKFPIFFSIVLFQGLFLQVILMSAIQLLLFNASVNETSSSNLA